MLSVFFRTLMVYLILSFALRLMGKRQIGELQLSELVVTLLVSEIATIPIVEPDIPIYTAFIPLSVLLTLEIVLTYLKNKSKLLKKILESSPAFLIRNGVLDQKELLRMRISLNELLAELRIQGISDISDIDYAILEENGKLSLIPKAEKQGLTPEDIHIKVSHRGLAHPVIVDGEINHTVLKHANFTEAMLKKELSARSLKPTDLFLMTIDDNGQIYCIKKEEMK